MNQKWFTTTKRDVIVFIFNSQDKFLHYNLDTFNYMLRLLYELQIHGHNLVFSQENLIIQSLNLLQVCYLNYSERKVFVNFPVAARLT